jgi:hypothetical protein
MYPGCVCDCGFCTGLNCPSSPRLACWCSDIVLDRYRIHKNPIKLSAMIAIQVKDQYTNAIMVSITTVVFQSLLRII